MAKRKTNTQIVNGLVKQFNDSEMVYVSAIIRQAIDEYVEHYKDVDIEEESKTNPFIHKSLFLAVKTKEYLDGQYGNSF